MKKESKNLIAVTDIGREAIFLVTIFIGLSLTD